MSDDVMANFVALDELIQVIYQGMDKFVVLSDVSDDKWNIHLGLVGPEGRWWQGDWRPTDVLAIVGKASDTLLESFAEKLASSIVQGELQVEAETGERYKLILGPTTKKPMHVSLTEMSPAEAAAYATEVFANIALQAQSRQSRLNPSAVASFASTSVQPRVSSSTKPATEKVKAPADDRGDRKAAARTATGSPDKEAQEEIKALKAELVKQQQRKRHASPEARPSSSKPAVAAKTLKGASLANPNKKARKYQAIEFASDEE